MEVGGQAELDGAEFGVDGNDVEGDAEVGGALVEDFHCEGRLGHGEGRGGGFHDAGFVPGDFVDGGAE